MGKKVKKTALRSRYDAYVKACSAYRNSKLFCENIEFENFKKAQHIRTKINSLHSDMQKPFLTNNGKNFYHFRHNMPYDEYWYSKVCEVDIRKRVARDAELVNEVEKSKYNLERDKRNFQVAEKKYLDLCNQLGVVPRELPVDLRFVESNLATVELPKMAPAIAEVPSVDSCEQIAVIVVEQPELVAAETTIPPARVFEPIAISQPDISGRNYVPPLPETPKYSARGQNKGIKGIVGMIKDFVKSIFSTT